LAAVLVLAFAGLLAELPYTPQRSP